MFNTASNCRIHKHRLPDTSADAGFPVCVSETDGRHMRPPSRRALSVRTREQAEGVFRISPPLAVLVSRGSAPHLCTWSRSAPVSRPQRGCCGSRQRPPSEDRLRGFTSVLLCGVCMFFTCQGGNMRGQKAAVQRKWGSEAEVLADASGERKCS